MTITDIQNPAVLKPVLTWDGKPWCQLCYICLKQIDLIKTMPHQRVRVGELVRHAKCRPEPVR